MRAFSPSIRPIEALLSPLDMLRRAVLRGCAPLLRPFIAHRERRVALTGVVVVLVAFLWATLAPLWMLALGPVLLGVPHLIGDARYLIVRPGLHKRAWVWLGVGLPLVWLDAGSWVGFLSAAGALVVARCGLGRKLLGLSVVLAGVGLAYALGWIADFLFVHLHNFIAVGIFLGWRRRQSRAYLWPLAAFLGATLLLVYGPLPWSASLSTPAPSLDAGSLVASYTGPGVDPSLGLRLLLAYAFAQSVHYSVWLRLIPEEDRAQPTPRSFLQSYRALVHDFGRPVLFALAALALGACVYGFFDLAQARLDYFEVARFHGYVELAVLALFWAESF